MMENDNEFEANGVSCAICLGCDWPKAQPTTCKHTFCFLCIKEWVKRRSECPLCKQQTEALLVSDRSGRQHKVLVAKRTAAQYEREISNGETSSYASVVEDITVAYARCRVCGLSNNEDLLMLCDGIVGHDIDGNPIFCNSACHCYCLPEERESVPDGHWFCSFCSDLRATQVSVYNARYGRQDYQESPSEQHSAPITAVEISNEDQPGPSGLNQGSLRNQWQNDASFIQDKECDAGPSTEESGSCRSEEMWREEHEHARDWEEQDKMVLATDSDSGYDPSGKTEVTWKRRLVGRKNFKKYSKKKAKENRRRGETSGKCQKDAGSYRKMRAKKSITSAQRRLAEVIGLDPLTGSKKKREVDRSRFKLRGYRYKSLGTPKLLIRGGDELYIPVEEPDSSDLQPVKQFSSKDEPRRDQVQETDLLSTIMIEQTKTFTMPRNRRILLDGATGGHRNWIRKDSGQLAAGITAQPADSKSSLESASMYLNSNNDSAGKEKRKSRPSRWGTPTTSESHENAVITASIPLPVGPPLLKQTFALENIPIPSTNQQASLAHVTQPSGPSTLNTANPSTSFPLNASTPFGITSGQPQINLNPFVGSTIGQQPMVTLNQQQLTNLGQQTMAGHGQQQAPSLNQPQLSLGQGSLVQMQAPLLPNLFLPPLNLNTVNNLLAAGLLTNNNPLAAPPITQSLAQPTSSATAPFILNPMQINQHLVNLATALHQRNPETASVLHTPPFPPQQPLKLPEGVPPPPPVIKPSDTVTSNISLCEPLAEKIRKLIEASNVRPLSDWKSDQSTSKATESAENKVDNEEICNELGALEAGRKSASADEEETGEGVSVQRSHKNSAMFEEARRMLSASLKKTYRMKQITKEEYKEIMKKGVTALSQRTKLEQKKVDKYAAKYVECIIHRRKKRH